MGWSVVGDVLTGAAVLLAAVAVALSVWCVARTRDARDEARSATAEAKRVAAWCGVPRYWREADGSPRRGVAVVASSPEPPTEVIPTQPAETGMDALRAAGLDPHYDAHGKLHLDGQERPPRGGSPR